jgi:alkylation response protein AidB-like acyl-CoA dehydrogenase
MELNFSEEQTMFGDMVRRLCEDVFPPAALRALEGTEPGYSAALWRALCELGITGVQIAEQYDGLGLGALEAAVIFEQFGRSLAISPHFISSILAADFIARAGTPSQQQQWLPAIAAGSALVTIASIEPGGDFNVGGVSLNAERRGDQFYLSGTKHFVPFAGSADALIVLARAGEKIIALLIDANAPGITRRYQANLAREPYFELTFAAVCVPLAAVLNEAADSWPLWQESMYGGLIPLAAQAVGAATYVHEISVAYAKQREAFGRPIGGFQAIAHYLADMLVEIEGCRTLVHQAAWARDHGKPFHMLAAMAKLQSCSMFRRAAALAIQVHGGLGYTIEGEPQLYFRRAKQWQSLFWNETTLEEKIADFVLGPLTPEAIATTAIKPGDCADTAVGAARV